MIRSPRFHARPLVRGSACAPQWLPVFLAVVGMPPLPQSPSLGRALSEVSGSGNSPPSPSPAREPSSEDLLCYAARYPDLAANYGEDTGALLRHWNRHGRSEGRNPYCTPPPPPPSPPLSPPLPAEATATSCSSRRSLPCVSTLCDSVVLACSVACRAILVYW